MDAVVKCVYTRSWEMKLKVEGLKMNECMGKEGGGALLFQPRLSRKFEWKAKAKVEVEWRGGEKEESLGKMKKEGERLLFVHIINLN